MKKYKVFVILPFLDDFLDLYEVLKERYKNDFVFHHAGDMDNQQNILKDIVYGINEADVVIADLTGLNPNVFYELGLAHATKNKVIILTQDIGELPFDIKSYRAIEYSVKFNKIDNLYKELDKLLNGVKDNSIQFGNPVTDFVKEQSKDSYDLNEIERIEKSSDTSNLDEENGFLDYIIGMNDNSQLIQKEIVGLSSELEEISKKINDISDEIGRKNTNYSSVDISYIKNLCRKIATPVEKGAEKIITHIGSINTYWRKMENDYLLLLDNKHFKRTENIDTINKNINSLKSIKNELIESNDSIEDFDDKINMLMGIERRLNRAMNTLSSGFNDYRLLIEIIVPSIDRLINKSNFVLESLE